MKPALFTFDIFGTVIDWRTGLRVDTERWGCALNDDEFEAVINAQAIAETGSFRSYTDITADSLVQVLGLPPDAARLIAQNIGRWPLFADSREALRRLMSVAPCAAMSNSDHAHGVQVQEQLGFNLSHWFCAEETRTYKPNIDFWTYVSEKLDIKPDPHWWHVSAYADYDLDAARRLGLSTVFISRPHSRPGKADYQFEGLEAFASHVT